MRLGGLVGLALLSSITVAPDPAEASILPPLIPPSCGPLAPLPPGPLRAHQANSGGILLRWDDELNPLLGVQVDSYVIYKVTANVGVPPPPSGGGFASVGGNIHEFLDSSGTANDTYWVRAMNCNGEGEASNPANTWPVTTSCVDWDLDPLTNPSLWVDQGCFLGPPCFLVVYLIPPDTDMVCY